MLKLDSNLQERLIWLYVVSCYFKFFFTIFGDCAMCRCNMCSTVKCLKKCGLNHIIELYFLCCIWSGTVTSRDVVEMYPTVDNCF